jgi:hypothetical protein
MSLPIHRFLPIIRCRRSSSPFQQLHMLLRKGKG